MLRGIIIAAAAFMLGLPALANTNLNLESLYLTDVLCKSAVKDQLKSLRVTHEWAMPLPREVDGSYRLLSPTEIVGVWVEARVYLNKEVVLRRVTENFVETREFDLLTCKVKQTANKENKQLASQQAKATEFFGDRDLRALMKSQSKGVIYIWSPNMPYSFRPLPSNTTGIENIKAAAAKIGAQVTVLRDPAASKEAVEEIIREEKGMDKSYGRSAQSVEIGLRAMGTHYPVVILFANGKLARYGYPGVGTQQEYLKYLQGQLNELQK